MEDDILPGRTDLLPVEIADLLDTCLRSMCFTYREKYCEQREGVAMGSPVFHIVTDLYMEFFEDIALHTAPNRPRLWKRYVDDTCCIVKKGEVDQLLQHLNGIHPSIKFTVEVEEGGKLPFLDTSLKKNDDSSIDITVYRKATHTGRWYLNYQSHHPVHVKRGLVMCLYDRTKNIVCSQDKLRKEEQHLAAVLSNNGYPCWFHQQIFGAHSQSSRQQRGCLKTSSNCCYTIFCGYE